MDRNAKLRERFKDPEVKKQHRNRMLKYKFGITLEQYNEMFTQQEGKCNICQRHVSEIKKTLAVDHDHLTGQVRSLLCDFCNRTLGVYESRPGLFDSFNSYLRKHKCQTSS